MFKAEDGSYPYRQKPLRIPTLRQALRAIPPQVPVFLDMKSLPVEPLVDAVAGELERQKAWSRVRFYSTEKAANDYLALRGPRATVRKPRCDAQPPGRPGLRRALRGTAGRRHLDGHRAAPRTDGDRALHPWRVFLQVPAAQLWTRKAMDCVRREPVKVVMFGIETAEDYRTARALGADAVMSNSPRKMEAIRRRVLADQPGG